MESDNFIDNQLSLFNKPADKSNQCQSKIFSLSDAEIVMFYGFFHKDESNRILADLYENVKWKQEDTFLYGRKVTLPRLTAWYGDQGKIYTYSKIKMSPNPWIPILEHIKFQVEKKCGKKFNSVLLNLYRNGSDSIAWHSDDEKELGENPTIASLSFGDTRSFVLRHRFNKDLKAKIELTHGSLLIMGGTTQHYWQHQIPKTRLSNKPRINLTFRRILG